MSVPLHTPELNYSALTPLTRQTLTFLKSRPDPFLLCNHWHCSWQCVAKCCTQQTVRIGNLAVSQTRTSRGPANTNRALVANQSIVYWSGHYTHHLSSDFSLKKNKTKQKKPGLFQHLLVKIHFKKTEGFWRDTYIPQLIASLKYPRGRNNWNAVSRCVKKQN